VGDGLGTAARVGTGEMLGTAERVGTGELLGTAEMPGTAARVGTATGPAAQVTEAIGLGVPPAASVGTGIGVAFAHGAGLREGLAMAVGNGLAAGLLGLADDEGVPVLVEAAVAVWLWWLATPLPELTAAPAEHPPHSMARPATPPAARTAQLIVARAWFCVESMHSS